MNGWKNQTTLIGRTLFVLCCTLLFAANGQCQVVRHKGMVESSNYQHKTGSFAFQVTYIFSVVAGQPTYYYSFRYESPDEGTKIRSIQFRSRVQSEGQLRNAYVKIKPNIAAPGEWSRDIPGSPSWGPGEKSWKPFLKPIFYNAKDQPVDAKLATEIYQKGISLVGLEVLDIDVSTKEKDPQRARKPNWLQKPFLQQRHGEPYVPEEVERHFRKNLRSGEVRLEVPAQTESNLPKSNYDATVQTWKADDGFVYARIRFRWIKPPNDKKGSKPVKAQVQVVWSGQPKNPKVNRSIVLRPGEEFTIVDRIQLPKIVSLKVQPGLVVKFDLPIASKDNPFAKLKQKEIEARKNHNPFDQLVEMKRRRDAVDLAEQKRLAEARRQKEALALKMAMAKRDREAKEKAKPEAKDPERIKRLEEKGRIAYVRASASFTAQYAPGFDLSNQKSARAEVRKINAQWKDHARVSKVYRIELPDGVPWTFKNIPDSAKEILDNWSRNLVDKKTRQSWPRATEKHVRVGWFLGADIYTSAEASRKAQLIKIRQKDFHPPPTKELFQAR